MTDEGLTPTPRKIMLAIPVYGQVEADFMHSVQSAISTLTPYGYEFVVQMLRGESLITRARCILLHWFLESDCTDMLFLDADLSFHPAHVVELMESGHDVCANSYVKKEHRWYALEGQTIESGWDAFRKSHSATVALVAGDDEIVDGFARASYLSTGFMRITRAAAERMRDSHPELAFYHGGELVPGVFNTIIEDQQFLGEDYSFCRRWTNLGGELWCRIGGQPIWHIGRYNDIFVADDAPMAAEESR